MLTQRVCPSSFRLFRNLLSASARRLSPPDASSSPGRELCGTVTTAKSLGAIAVRAVTLAPHHRRTGGGIPHRKRTSTRWHASPTTGSRTRVWRSRGTRLDEEHPQLSESALRATYTCSMRLRKRSCYKVLKYAVAVIYYADGVHRGSSVATDWNLL